MLALPIFPCSHPQSIVGEGVLNFCVRDGNRWTHTPINTNYILLQKTERIYCTTQSSLCQGEFLVTRTGFEPMLTA